MIRRHREALLRWALPLVPAAAAFAAFLPVLRAGFVNWDDTAVLVENTLYRGLSPGHIRWMFSNLAAGHYQPVTWLSYAVDHSLWGMDPFGYHLTSLLFHAAGAGLFFSVSRFLLAARQDGGEAPGRKGWVLEAAALFSALLFALHPLRTETVAWVTERRGLLCAFFFLLSVRLYLSSTRAEGRSAFLGWAASLAAFAASLLSKPMAVTLPFVLLLLDVFPLRRLPPSPWQWRLEPWKNRVLEKWPFLLAAVLSSVVSYVGQTHIVQIRPTADLGLVERSAVASYALVFYLVKTVWPSGLSALHGMPEPFNPLTPTFIGAAVLAAFGLAAVWAWGRRRPALLAAAAFYALTLAPVSGIVPIGVHLVADRYSYISCMGWAILAGGGLALLLERAGRKGKLSCLAAALGLVSVLGGLSWRQSSFWKESQVLWERVLAVDPDTAVAHNNLGALLAFERRWEAAAVRFREALRLRPGHMEYRRRLSAVLYNAGNDLLEAGRSAEAVPFYKEAEGLSVGTPGLHVNLGLALAGSGRLEEACAEYAKALRLEPSSALARYNLGNALLELGRLGEAVSRFESSLRLSPELVEARFNLGNALARQGRYSEAMERYREVAKSSPLHPGLQENMDAVGRLLENGAPAERRALGPLW
ncbi:MAG: tetratricopeptide repeat protein [Elusimicrobia bacterium]|nr:tetratricopeptide repeat protein [Elusimicrobiota bacterium]